ncbi:MAG: hypothetical protein DHS20C01_25930 [marine bacterium B5-7]|nr:MAG: hypothetical protein DHS20C01_25930 [marine bacterium B5-7]
MNEAEEEYSTDLINFLEVVWGEGYLSPGGSEEVARIIGEFLLNGKRVLDIGCGSGGIAMELVERYGAGEVVGVDIERGVLARAAERVNKHGLEDRITLQQVESGPLPYDDESFDVAFSKDSMIHIPEKELLFADVYRILKPGGWFIASDWLIGHDDEPSDEMKHYIALEGLSFGMASPNRYGAALQAAGFDEISLTNRNVWYRDVAQRERDAIAGDLYDRACEAAGKAVVDHNIDTWTAMLTVLESGEHCPHHLRARKPD